MVHTGTSFILFLAFACKCTPQRTPWIRLWSLTYFTGIRSFRRSFVLTLPYAAFWSSLFTKMVETHMKRKKYS